MSFLLTKVTSKAKLVGIKAAMTLLPAPRPTVFSGEGAALKLCQAMASFGHRKVLIVSDKILNNLGVLKPLEAKLQALGVKVAIFDGVMPDPTFSITEACLQYYKTENCDSVLAVGGGSSIDVAKVVALAASTHKTPQQLVGILKGRKASSPLYAIPTTAGTGSEVTVGAVISTPRAFAGTIWCWPATLPTPAPKPGATSTAIFTAARTALPLTPAACCGSRPMRMPRRCSKANFATSATTRCWPAT